MPSHNPCRLLIISGNSLLPTDFTSFIAILSLPGSTYATTDTSTFLTFGIFTDPSIFHYNNNNRLSSALYYVMLSGHHIMVHNRNTRTWDQKRPSQRRGYWLIKFPQWPERTLGGCFPPFFHLVLILFFRRSSVLLIRNMEVFHVEDFFPLIKTVRRRDRCRGKEVSVIASLPNNK